MGKDR